MQKGLEELVIVGSRGIHDGHADRHAPPRIDTVRQRRIKQIDVIDNLRMLGFALGLFCRSNKMTERSWYRYPTEIDLWCAEKAPCFSERRMFPCLGSEVLHNAPITGALDLAATQP